MTLLLKFTHEEIEREIPYRIIAETASLSIWRTSKRNRAMSLTFWAGEREACNHIIRQAKRWMLMTGVPSDGVMMSLKTRKLWDKLAQFCAELER